MRGFPGVPMRLDAALSGPPAVLSTHQRTKESKQDPPVFQGSKVSSPKSRNMRIQDSGLSSVLVVDSWVSSGIAAALPVRGGIWKSRSSSRGHPTINYQHRTTDSPLEQLYSYCALRIFWLFLGLFPGGRIFGAIFWRPTGIFYREISLRNQAGAIAIAHVINQQHAIAMRPPPRPPPDWNNSIVNVGHK